MIHLDLFSGIGGFAYAVDQVWDDVEHIFCDTDKFCRAVLKKHWPESEIISDIRDITDTNFKRSLQGKPEVKSAKARVKTQPRSPISLVTGGFPCQPFSAAGVRRGTADKRYLWPEMFRVIRLTKPQWVIAENVRGLLTWKDGLVFEQVCTDLESEGYEVQPFIIPAIAVNAPHRRDRIWWVAYSSDKRLQGGWKARNQNGNWPKYGDQLPDRCDRGWDKDWLEVATELCSVDDGLSAELGEFKLSKSKHREEQIKAYGNAIVPQVAIEIMRGIAKSTEV